MVDAIRLGFIRIASNPMAAGGNAADPGRFDSRRHAPMYGGMAILPRPVSPRSALADLKLMFSADRPHRWTILGLSVALTAVMLWGFWLDSRPPKPQRQIIYVESWMMDRKDSDIIKRQQADLSKFEASVQERQRGYQKLADATGVEWREAEAKAREQRRASIEMMEKYLDKRLAEALAREAKQGKPVTAEPAAKPAN